MYQNVNIACGRDDDAALTWVSQVESVTVTDEELKRLHSPIGLDLGARTPEETAISIAAEIVQARWGGSGRHLTDTNGPIHPGAPR